MKYAIRATKILKLAAVGALAALALITAMERKEEPYDR